VKLLKRGLSNPISLEYISCSLSVQFPKTCTERFFISIMYNKMSWSNKQEIIYRRIILNRKTISLLPHFLLPYFQHTRDTILQSLRARFQKLSFSLCRQLTAYYHKRFLNNLPAIISVLRELGWREKLPDDFNKRAIKLVERLELTPPRDLTSPEVNLSNRIIANFMASSF
jgi:hypothetical protein